MTVRGRCPSLMRAMAAGDGLLVRVKPRAATLSAAQAEAVGAAAGRYGNGIVEPTNRGNLQIRGLSEAGAAAFAGRMAQIGLAAADPGAEAVRNILVDPLGADDPAAAFDSHRLARRLSAMLEGDPACHALPGKFGLLVDAGAALPMSGCSADIAIRPSARGAEIGLAGGDRHLGLAAENAEEAVRRLIAALLRWAGGAGAAPRMRRMVAACGAGAVFEAAGLAGVSLAGEGRPVSAGGPAGTRPRPGFRPLAGPAQGCLLVGIPFGSLEAPVLAALAGLSRRFADGTIRTTPWKAFVLPGVAPSEAGALRDAAAELGLIVGPGDPRSSIVACPGRPRCPGGHADSRADAAIFAATLGATFTGARPGDGLLHVSGCAKGCAHPAPAAVTLVATPDGYDLLRNGRPGDPPAHSGLTRAAAARLLAAAPPLRDAAPQTPTRQAPSRPPAEGGALP